MSNPGKIKVVVSYNGTETSLDANPHEAVKALLEHALNAFSITSNRHVLALFFPDNREITDVNQSLVSAGITDGTKLVLRQSTVLAG